MLLVILLSRYVEFPKMWYFYPTEVERSKFLACRENPPPKHLIPVPSLCGTSWSPHEENPEGGSGFTAVREDRGGGCPPIQQFFSKPSPSKPMLPMGYPALKNEFPHLKNNPPPNWKVKPPPRKSFLEKQLVTIYITWLITQVCCNRICWPLLKDIVSIQSVCWFGVINQ